MRILTLCLFLSTLCASLAAGEPLARVLPSPKSTGDAVLLEFDRDLFTRLAKSSNETEVDLPLPGGGVGKALVAGRVTQLFAPGATIILQGDGEPVIKTPPQVETVLGYLKGEEHSAVALTRIGDRYFGFVTRSSGATLSVTPAGKGFAKNAHQITGEFGDLERPTSFCDVQLPPGGAIPKEPLGAPKGVLQLKPIEIAVEGSYELYKFLEFDEDRAVEYTTQLVAAVSAIYETQLGASLQLAGIRQWVSYRDPFYGGSLTVLETARDMVANNQVPARFANADLIHVISTIRNRGGVAYLGVLDLCGVPAREYRTGFSDIYASTTFPSSSYSWDINVVAHELGHNVGSPHTHCYSPPIDRCYTVENGCATGTAESQIGTIMSYCHLVASVRLEFSPREVDLLRSSLDASNCIPGKVSVSPNPPLQGQPVTVTYDPSGGPLASAPSVILGRGTNDWASGQSTEQAMTANGALWEYTYDVPANTYSIVYYFKNVGNLYDNHNTLDWRFAVDQGFEPVPALLPDRVSITPDPPVRGRQATIAYNPAGTPLSSTDPVSIYRGQNGWKTVFGNTPMTFDEQSSTWRYDWELPLDATSIEFDFNDGATTWDNNNGDDWHFRTVAEPYSSDLWILK